MQSPDPRDQIIAELRADLALLRAELAELREENARLKAQLKQNSTNSSKPPSTDPPGLKRREKKATGRRPGGQPGHTRHLRELLPIDQVDEVKVLRPEACEGCGERLWGEDPSPVRHQVIEVPEIKPSVSEWQLHALRCRCGKTTRAQLPAGVPRGAFGPVFSSVVALCTVRFHQSKRLAQELLCTLLNVKLSLGMICKIEQQTSAALSMPVEEAYCHVQEQGRANADETGWYEGKSDGKKRLVWLWTVTTMFVTVFRIASSRGEDMARRMLGDDFAGILGSDRWGAYNFVDPRRRQLCWSHLIRDFQGFVDRKGEGGQAGEMLLVQVERMFDLWHKVRDGTLARQAFIQQMKPIQKDILRHLRYAVAFAEPKTRGMAAMMLKLKASFFTFVHAEGVEPTNNVSEQRIRQAVILRKLSFGTDSENGSRFVERMLTTTTTLRQQNRNVLQFLIAAHTARLQGSDAPSLLPAS